MQQEYIPLDSALVRAILSDYHLSRPEELRRARADLDELKACAIADDSNEFGPSGTSGLGLGKITDSSKSTSEDTEVMSSSNGVSNVSIESGSDEFSEQVDDGAFLDYEKQDVKAKGARLRELFPTESQRDIEHTLKKCDGSFTRAMDILLNYVFLRNGEEGDIKTAVPWKSIDAFAEEYVVTKNKRKKRKGRKFRSLQEFEDDELANGSPSTPNRWANADDDISFLASRTTLSRQKISSIYHQNGASRKPTILAIIRQDISNHDDRPAEDLALEPGVLQLIDVYPSISITYAASIIRLAPSTTKAHDLAKALVASPTASGTSTPSRIIPHYSPYMEASGTSTPRSASPSIASTPTYSRSAVSLSAARTEAFNKASSYYRKSKSDRLMGGAAAYYAQLGRDYHASLQSASAAEADALGAAQSTATTLDLHCVSVKDAVRIAEQRVGAWWDGLGESRARMGNGRAVGDGYRIVTGVGRHSDGGVAKVGPAVVRALVKDGWKVEIASGVLMVMGKAKR